jgi:hypothetical protein
MLEYLTYLWDTLSLPSAKNQTPEMALIRGLSHAVAGAAAALVMPWWLIGAMYAFFKEVPDIKQGGDARDSAFDIGFVVIGAVSFYAWPVAAILFGLFHGWIIWRYGNFSA